MTIRTVYHAADGEQFDSRAAAQQYERATEFITWLVDEKPDDFFPGAQSEFIRKDLARAIAKRWYLLDRTAKRKRGKPHFTGRTCLVCGGQMEEIASIETCVTCAPAEATRLRAIETGEATDAADAR